MLILENRFFGGRTNNLKFYHEAKSDEIIYYYDFTSLYPYVLKTYEYPIGHPKIIQDNFDYSLNSYFGFVKCTVDPPRKLYLPVLPLTIENKLIFPLCKECAKEFNQEDCLHNESQRELTNTWTTIELKVAIEKGYKIKKIYQVLNYKDSNTKIFKDYINMWLKIKQESSGYPNWCTNDIAKDEYIKKYYEKEEINLDKSKIEKKPTIEIFGKDHVK